MPLGGLATAGLIVAGAGVVTSGVEGIIENHKANEIKPKDPVYNIPAEFYQNREIARQMAEIGLPQQQYNNAENNINQTQASAIAAAQNSNNPGAAITNVVRQTNQEKSKLGAEDDQARQNNQRYFVNENKDVANQLLAKQQSDVFDKFTRDFNQMQAYRGAATQNFNNAISGAQSLGETAINYASANSDPTGTKAYKAQQFANRGSAPVLDNTGTPVPAAYTPPNPFGGTTPYIAPGGTDWSKWNGSPATSYANPYFPQ